MYLIENEKCGFVEKGSKVKRSFGSLAFGRCCFELGVRGCFGIKFCF